MITNNKQLNNQQQTTEGDMKKFRFLEWKVYKDSKELFAYILGIVRKLPSDLRWSIGSQLTRASFSIV